MAVFIVPPFDQEPWPSLGGQVCDLIEDLAVFGPGSLKGLPARLDDEKRAAIWKSYEIFPRGHELEGRRRFQRVRFSWRKGSAKTELMGWVAFAELHPEGPVRFDGWDASGNPVGRPVRDPYIPLLAYRKDQVEELAYNVLKVVCEESPDSGLFDTGLERIIRLDRNGRPDGKAVPLANSPGALDGARTTFQGFDETHRLDTDRLRNAYNTMEANLPKRPLDDPWSLGTTTAGVPGAGSVAEIDRREADAIARGDIDEPQLLYFHREAGADCDLTTLTGRIEAVREASGPAIAAWSDLRSIAKMWEKPGADQRYLERVWLNRWTQADAQAFDLPRWRDNARPGLTIPKGSLVSLGLDGSRWRDTTALVATSLDTGLQVKAGLWRPDDYADGIPIGEVLAALRECFDDRWTVVRAYFDPAFEWSDAVAEMQGQYGQKRIFEFYTDSRNLRRTAQGCRTYATAIRTGDAYGNGDDDLERHLGASQKRDIKMVDEDGVPLWVIEKAARDSPDKIDLAMAGMLSYQARLDAIRSGENQQTEDWVWVG